ncbi:DNA-binding MarR family transcriptional regulator [Neobacillus niacini]|uniref:MarR family winged helix-turn-helix transcriptional regulator n=1 Tax=Neobacillus driksii TaxID=3035913 RepID=UPI002784BDAC|nr:MarR family transcriptional regulator [Neobacillus niacini]MDQ0970819.1 DNA-binding MarR family transcriptional regulator [Neobacillus niacini]
MDREKVFHELMETLYETTRLMSDYHSVPRTYGTEDELYMVEAHTLNLIGDQIKTNTSEIAAMTNRTKGAISQMIDKLVKKGLVAKYKNPDNHREMIIELTPKGKIVYNYHKKLDTEEFRKPLKNLEHLTTEDFQKFIIMLKTIIKWQ